MSSRVKQLVHETCFPLGMPAAHSFPASKECETIRPQLRVQKYIAVISPVVTWAPGLDIQLMVLVNTCVTGALRSSQRITLEAAVIS